ncbi:Spx/MgsR family RNA polymerase-binding regulatory protein [Aquisalimonas sp.]|uniref:Spx/MgsR family RNA polymerase-binding regulatory protein n=1 Tax=unclassified Aquisalimonas TaxID=2644645 RepID=UPI0025BD7450|nr:Spx/MgsR family RNA polymerase-binding regulatory protein [Aquisalimonas sp.]
MATVYGIKSCDTCRKAMKWLELAGVEATFHDVRRDGVPAALDTWVQQLGAAELVNRRSTTWRQLDEDQRQRAASEPAALLREQPTLIRRPVLDTGDQVLVGFREADYRAALGVEQP